MYIIIYINYKILGIGAESRALPCMRVLFSEYLGQCAVKHVLSTLYDLIRGRRKSSFAVSDLSSPAPCGAFSVVSSVSTLPTVYSLVEHRASTTFEGKNLFQFSHEYYTILFGKKQAQNFDLANYFQMGKNTKQTSNIRGKKTLDKLLANWLI